MSMTWQDIPADRYLDEALALNDDERERLAIALAALPRDIFDAHTHAARAVDVVGLSVALLGHTVSTFPVYTLEMAERVRRALWPGKTVRSARMAHAVAGYRHREINNYLLSELPDGDLLIGFGIHAESGDACREIHAGKFAAVKMYFRSVDPPLTRVREVFPDDVLSAAEAAGVPIILHLPTALPGGLDEVLDLVDRYQRLRIVLAHLGGHGGQFFSSPVLAALDALADIPTVFMDTALVFDAALLRAAVERFGPDRILFGTDEPLNLIRATPYIHPELGPRLFAPGYHWARDDGAPESVRSSPRTLLHIQMLEALTAAVDGDPVSLHAIFHDTPARVLSPR